MRMRWLLALVPAILGLGFGTWLTFSSAPNPLLYAQVDLATLISLAGLILSILVLVFLGTLAWVEKVQLKATQQAAQDRRRFFRRLDHELKNPITAILAGLANLSLAESQSDQSAIVNSIQVQVERLRRLVAELRKLAELETRPLERSIVDMTEVLEDAFALANGQSSADQRVLHLSIPRAPWPLPTISGDRDLLILAVHNLLDNAIKFTGPGNTIEMRAFEDSRHVVVEIADTGPGIPSNEIPLIWDELYRGEAARGIPGSGLGLALVRAIVILHDGTITLRSRPGEGTIFTMRLPIGN
jgi:two-component system OmpR family sensor kinase